MIIMNPQRKGRLVTSIVLLLIASPSSTSKTSGGSSSVRGGINTIRRRDTETTRSTIFDRKLSSMDRCLLDKTVAERSQIGVECMCKSKADRGIVLVCSDQCAFCNDDQSVCGIKSTETLYNSENGTRVGIGLVFEYLKPGSAMLEVMSSDLISTAHVMGENNTQVQSPVVVLGIEEVGCEEDEDTEQLVSCDTCNVYLGGSKCESCQLVECGEPGSGIIAPVMNCSNLQPVSGTISVFDDMRHPHFYLCTPNIYPMPSPIRIRSLIFVTTL
jgi:hypothetical protein